MRWVICLLLALTLSGCFHVQTTGPVAGATIKVAHLHNTGEILTESESWDAERLRQILGDDRWLEMEMATRVHLMGFGSLDLSGIEPGQLYLVTAHGGEVVEMHDNGDSDASYTPFHGELHAVVTGRQLLEENFILSPVTELAYQWIKPAIPFIDDMSILSELDYISRHLVIDVDLDGVVNALDVLRANPIYRPNSFRGSEDQIHTMSRILTDGSSAEIIHEWSHCILDDLPSAEDDHLRDEPGGMHMGGGRPACGMGHMP